ncbi:portal protein [Pseudovibrio sp. POLY-S9]|uniref:portal protein n=1 Tax=Pseudovibrio sp. POLY-S9 TaxID=1576596 RepID=UPI0009E9AF01|nr:portal protein [Pseudovibrio sp. POLY-S9]
MNVDLAKVKRRSDDAWGKRAPWTRLYQDAYDYCIPMRRPGGNGNAAQTPDRLFDMTAPASAMAFAGNLQRDLFPSGQENFELEAGPLAAMALDEKDVKTYNRHLAKTSKLIHPFFLNGDWDTAVHEACIDLAAGSGALIPLKGDQHNPVFYASIPFDQLAVGCDAWGRVNFVSWKQTFTYEQLRDAFKDGKFPENIKSKVRSHPNSEVEVRQDFFQDARGRSAGWHMVVYVQECSTPIKHEHYRTQPIAIPRYYRVPGEAYGRGVILTALPSIKTVNKAQELALKSAAISMLGIWGYRAGGTFNPDTSRLAPGEFWAMQSTGGMLGPDIQRLDAGGRLDIGNMIIGNLQGQIRDAMFDTRLPEYNGTPKAASEITARMRQKADVHIGAFGRLVREIMPVIVPRTTEILFDAGVLTQVTPRIDELLLSIKVKSPMAAALNADRLASIANYLEFVGAIAGPEQTEMYAHIDKIMEKVGDGMQIDKDLIPTEAERGEIEKKINERKTAQIIELFSQRMAEKGPDMVANAVQQEAA